MAEKFFITGTDTGVGKTVFTSFLLWHLRSRGGHALAMKPLCSGGREDAYLLNQFQDEEVDLDCMNPFYFERPLSPLVAARSEGRKVLLKSMIGAIKGLDRNCAQLLIEGAGGLLSPLGEGFTFLDIMLKVGGKVIVIAKNRLGVMNHVLLTEEVLKQNGIQKAKYVLMEEASDHENDEVRVSNLDLLREFLGINRIFSMPYMGKNPCKIGVFKKHERFFQKTVAPFVGVGRLIAVARRKSVTKSDSQRKTELDKN